MWVLSAWQDSLATCQLLLMSIKVQERSYSWIFSTHQQSIANSVFLVSYEPKTWVIFKFFRGTKRYLCFVNLNMSCTVSVLTFKCTWVQFDISSCSYQSILMILLYLAVLFYNPRLFLLMYFLYEIAVVTWITITAYSRITANVVHFCWPSHILHIHSWRFYS